MRLGATRKPRQKSQEEVETTEEATTERPSDNTLRALNIPLQTIPNDDIYSSQDIDIIQFQVSKPEGYFFGHVDEFVKSVKQTISWYEATLERRTSDIYRIVEELDRVTLAQVELRNELEEIHQQGGVFVETAGNTAALEAQIAEKDAQIAQYVQAITEFETWAEQIEREKAETDVWVTEATNYIQELEANSNGVADTQETDARIEQFKEEIASLEEQLQSLNTQTPGITEEEFQTLKDQHDQLTQWSEEVQTYVQAIEEENAALKTAAESSSNLQGEQTLASEEDVIDQVETETMSSSVDEEVYDWIEKANEYIQDLEAQNETLRNQIEQRGNDGDTSAEFQTKLKEFEDYVSESQITFEDQSRQIETLKQALNDANALIAANETYIASLETQSVDNRAVEDEEDYEEVYEEEEEGEYEEVGLPILDEASLNNEEYQGYALPNVDEGEEEEEEESVIGDEKSVAFLPKVTPEEELQQEEEFENLLVEMLDRGPEHEIPLTDINTEGDYVK